MFVADRLDEVLHVIVAFTRVGARYLQIATWFRFIDSGKLPLGFLVVEHLGCQNHVTRFGVEEIAVLVRRILHGEAKLFEVHPDLTSGMLAVHLRNSCLTSSDKPQSAPHWSRCTTRRHRWELTLPANVVFCEHGQWPSSAPRHEALRYRPRPR